ncbi:MAG TPA: hypothetical protein VFQ61_01400 [Polyangiaceae bacterium]|nr:hypothetical protein [Polyangiaceae bacterium]
MVEIGEKLQRADPLRALVHQVIDELLTKGGPLIPLEVLIQLELVGADEVAAWRNGELPYLERGMTSGLSRVARVLRLIEERALELGLTATRGKYVRRGPGRKQSLRFSKRGDAESERLYSRHFVRPAGAER